MTASARSFFYENLVACKRKRSRTRTRKVTVQDTPSGPADDSQVTAAATVTTLADPAIGGFAFDRTNPNAVAKVQEQAADLITGISETTREQIKELVEQAFTDPDMDVHSLADEIDNIIDDPDRAETIARTEVMQAANDGQLEAWDQAQEDGLLTGQEQKEWIVTPDDRLCPVCEPMDGVTVGIDEDFDVDGDEMEGPPAHPNCRCTIGLSNG
jgi:SPP1 gp7 family putative phage head morphogenesis protein